MKSRKAIMLAFMVTLLICTVLAGCSRDAGPGYVNINEVELKTILQNEKDHFLVDVREPHELEETGYIPGAVNIPQGQLENNLKSLPKSGKLVLYCRTGRRSAEAAGYLVSMGYSNVYNLQGGIVAWPYEKVKPR